jgi:malonyl-CoA O-methyltransferase
VVSGLVLEHLDDLAGFFKEVRRVLAPGGRAVLSALHPAMFLRGTAARFLDPDTGMKVYPGSLPHQVGDFVMAALGAGLQVEGILEQTPTPGFVAFHPKAAEFAHFPMLLILRLRA